MRRLLALTLSATILCPSLSWAAQAEAPAPQAPAPASPPDKPRSEPAQSATSLVEPSHLEPYRQEPLHVEPPKADPELARANADMLAVYRATSAAVFGDAQADLWESQRLWTRYADEMCQYAQDLTTRSPRIERHETQSQCLTRAASAREAELKAALQTVGPWTFLRITDHRVHPPHPGRGDALVPEAITRVQLARPETDAGRRWNLAVARQLELVVNAAYDQADSEVAPSGEGRDIALSAGVDVAAVTADLIDVSVHATADPVGPPAPRTSARGLIWSMRLGRPIEDSDLFDPRERWRPSLAQMAADRLAPDAPAGASAATVLAVAPLAADPTRWTLTPAGLQIDLHTPAATAGSGAALVPWSLLSPYLKRPWFVNPSSLVEPIRG